MSNIIERARQLRAIMDKAGAMFDDKQASEVIELYPTYRYSGELVKAGSRIKWNGVLKRAAVDLWETPENTPDNAPTLWEDIMYKNGVRIIPEIITAGLAFVKGEQGYWKDAVYESLIDGNVWNPEGYAAGWKLIEE